jgi:hypothetical protein
MRFTSSQKPALLFCAESTAIILLGLLGFLNIQGVRPFLVLEPIAIPGGNLLRFW